MAEEVPREIIEGPEIPKKIPDGHYRRIEFKDGAIAVVIWPLKEEEVAAILEAIKGPEDVFHPAVYGVKVHNEGPKPFEWEERDGHIIELMTHDQIRYRRKPRNVEFFDMAKRALGRDHQMTHAMFLDRFHVGVDGVVDKLLFFYETVEEKPFEPYEVNKFYCWGLPMKRTRPLKVPKGTLVPAETVLKIGIVDLTSTVDPDSDDNFIEVPAGFMAGAGYSPDDKLIAFVTDESLRIPIEKGYGYVRATCIEPGIYGKVEANKVNKLHSSIAYVQSVTNPIASWSPIDGPPK